MTSDIAFDTAAAPRQAQGPSRRKGDLDEAERESRIYEALLVAIVERRLPPGAKLPEIELAEIFGTNRSRIRRVLGRLAQERMVSQVLNRGSFVARPTVEDAREVFDARRLLERSLVRAAAERLGERALQRLRAHVEREREAARRGDALARVRLSGEFHLLLAEVAGNRILEDVLRELVARSSLVVALYEHVASADCSHEEHGTILDALAAGEAGAAADAMLHHLSEIEERLRLDQPEEPKIDLRSLFAGAR
ncbi:DNA-binding transcriptional regulator, GntR family [Tistlia consotensis]|uniref:DNA-binding transcriptional regulator, GntR family n=1 Tax=Tistlia consotensis USBA 355 TaxID=560819 RepID=A0A1Y6CIY3_9PROT|nr:GntR family transcriptional regulator [Tistlia consotensis]SMF68884.1 DNA-binding transcriptional regulator, GntR family [Tistlia consotensis USBA 355]SNS01550.1 DNA-binding transcriptional regulator, GntR family [Tistlia consotensis]